MYSPLLIFTVNVWFMLFPQTTTLKKLFVVIFIRVPTFKNKTFFFIRNS